MSFSLVWNVYLSAGVAIRTATKIFMNMCLSSLNIVIRNGKIVWKHGPYCSYFRLNLKYLRWPYIDYIKTAKNGGFYKELLSENDVEAVLGTFCCYDYGANASEAVQRITTDQKDSHK